MKKLNKEENKKTGEELLQYLMFKRRGSVVKSKKTYTRKQKHKYQQKY